jgi:hypothetical protein
MLRRYCNPASNLSTDQALMQDSWIPAFAGMTFFEIGRIANVYWNEYRIDVDIETI